MITIVALFSRYQNGMVAEDRDGSGSNFDYDGVYSVAGKDYCFVLKNVLFFFFEN